MLSQHRNMALTTHRVRLNRQDRRPAPEHAQPVLDRLLVEDAPARQGHHTRLDALPGELRSRLERDRHLGAGRGEREVLALDLVHDVAALERTLDRRPLEVRQVLAREREDGGRLGARERGVVGGGGLVAVSRTPDVDIGGGTEVEDGLDGLVSGTVFTETDGVVGGDPDNLVSAESREPDGTSGIRDEVLHER